jgi:hypothetical protein
VGAGNKYAGLATPFMELEIEAQPNLTELPVSALQIDNSGDVVWLAKMRVMLANPTNLITLRKEPVPGWSLHRPDNEFISESNSPL